jgi:hypothetical protein
MPLHLKKGQFRVKRHLLLARVQILTPECRLVTARFGRMAIAAKLTMN